MKELMTDLMALCQKLLIELVPFGMAFALVALIYHGVFSLGHTVHLQNEGQAQAKLVQSKGDSIRHELVAKASNYTAFDSASAPVVLDSIQLQSIVKANAQVEKLISQMEEQKAEDVRSNTLFWEQFPWITLISSFLIAIGLFWSYLYYKRHNVSRMEQDPPMLSQLLTHEAQSMQALKTPRKIKRFINKIRLQYFLYSENSSMGNIHPIDLQDRQTALDFFHILLAIETQELALDDYPLFVHACQAKRPGANPSLINNIYEFNKDIIM